MNDTRVDFALVPIIKALGTTFLLLICRVVGSGELKLCFESRFKCILAALHLIYRNLRW